MAISYFNTVQSFIQFLWNWVLKGGKLVDQNTANLRASICAGCHNNLPSSEVGKSKCCGGSRLASFAIDKARASIIKKNLTTSDKKLLVCSLCGCDLRIKVWIPIEAMITPEDINAYPTFCFMKKITEGKQV